MKTNLCTAGLAALLYLGGPQPHLCAAAAAAADAVRSAESAFADTMARRDFADFGAFVSREAVFFAGPKPLRGKEAVLVAWKGYFDGVSAPFSWKPEIVEVLESGKLALSSGPVVAPDGKLIGRYNSIWRLEDDGKWRVVFDRGEKICN